MSGRGRGRKRRAQETLPPIDNSAESGNNRTVIDFEHIIAQSGILQDINTAGCGSVGHTLPSFVHPEHPSTTQSVIPNTTFMQQPPIDNPAIANTAALQQVRLSNDDLAIHVPNQIKQQIIRGEYINLAILLKGAIEMNALCSGGYLTLNSEGRLETKQFECKDKIMSIEKWTDAFLIYSSIYLKAHPDKTPELLHYAYTIRECAVRQGGTAWKTYDEQFRLRQAQTPASWGCINNDLWWRCISLRENAAHTSNTNSSYTCNDFNKGGCSRPNCKFAHHCSSCGASHAQMNCQNHSQAQTSSSQRQAYNSFRSRGRGFPYFNQVRTCDDTGTHTNHEIPTKE